MFAGFFDFRKSPKYAYNRIILVSDSVSKINVATLLTRLAQTH